MKEIQSEKSCQNCRYYSEYYLRRGTKFVKAFCGNCINRNVKNNKIRPFEVCKYWKDMIIKKLEIKKSIKNTLTVMSKQLNDIALFLKDDESV